jgi:hypothetical protein
MSKQLALSAAFSVLMMAIYVLFGADALRQPLQPSAIAGGSVQISAPGLPEPARLLPSLR